MKIRPAWALGALIGVLWFYVAIGAWPYLLWVAGYTSIILVFVYSGIAVKERRAKRKERNAPTA